LNLSQDTTSNRLLKNLSAADFTLLKPSCTFHQLPVRRQIESRNRSIQHLYFFEGGIASTVVTGSADHSIEVTIIGNEGMSGIPVLLGTDKPLHETFMQVEGTGWRIASSDFQAAISQSLTLREMLSRYVHTVMMQMAFTSLSNGRYKLEERLARWLLMAQDRCRIAEIKLTHEFLAMMLGTRRAGVTVALNAFESHGIIQLRRGCVIVIDRHGLELSANGCYGTVEAEYERLFPAK
jgi:CRP-like cAMP-binding protein